jgi:hypothetical protein
MRTKIVLAAGVIAAASFTAGRLVSQEGMPSPEDMAKMMEMMRPGEEHDVLAEMEGEWEQDWSTSMMPGAPAQRSKGSATGKLILGDRFLELQSKGAMMGQPFEAKTILGFDRRHGVYTMAQFDTMGTYFVTATGKRDPQTGTIVLMGKDTDPMMGEQEFKTEITPKQDEIVTTFTFMKLGAFPIPPEGWKCMEIVAKRKKAGG